MILYSQLKTELQTDPLGLGYAAPLAAGNHAAVADLLNEVRPTIQIQRDLVPVWEVFDAIVPSEWGSLSTTERTRIQIILTMQQVYVKGTNTRNAFTTAFAAGTQTRANLIALQNRTGSRAEQLFDQAVTYSDIATALEV